MARKDYMFTVTFMGRQNYIGPFKTEAQAKKFRKENFAGNLEHTERVQPAHTWDRHSNSQSFDPSKLTLEFRIPETVEVYVLTHSDGYAGHAPYTCHGAAPDVTLKVGKTFDFADGRRLPVYGDADQAAKQRDKLNQEAAERIETSTDENVIQLFATHKIEPAWRLFLCHVALKDLDNVWRDTRLNAKKVRVVKELDRKERIAQQKKFKALYAKRAQLEEAYKNVADDIAEQAANFMQNPSASAVRTLLGASAPLSHEAESDAALLATMGGPMIPFLIERRRGYDRYNSHWDPKITKLATYLKNDEKFFETVLDRIPSVGGDNQAEALYRALEKVAVQFREAIQ